jgi:hypothetical protein
MATPTASRKKLFRFSDKDDIDLLICVAAVNPYTGNSNNKWSEIAEDFMDIHPDLSVDGKRCWERTSLLLAFFKDKEKPYSYRYEI